MATKYELERKLAAALAEVESLRRRVRDLEVEPGVFAAGWRGAGPHYAARPKPRDYETRRWLEDGAYSSLIDGDFCTTEGVTHTQLIVPRDDEVLPPGIEAAVIRYSYDHEGGCFIHDVWPAARITIQEP